MRKHNRVRKLVLLGLLTAISLVLSRLCVIYLTPSVKINFGNIPLLLGGLLFGPVAGGVIAAAADILGAAFLSGLGWYPPLTVGACLMGVVPGLLRRIAVSNPSVWRIGIVVLISNLVVGMCWNTWWLHVLYQTPIWSLLLVRVPLYLGMTVVETLALTLLLRSKPLRQELTRNGGTEV